MSTSNISLPLNFNQLLKLVKQLSTKDKQKLAGILNEDVENNIPIPEEHKNIVRSRIKKYTDNPELLIDWETAKKMIKTN